KEEFRDFLLITGRGNFIMDVLRYSAVRVTSGSDGAVLVFPRRVRPHAPLQARGTRLIPLVIVALGIRLIHIDGCPFDGRLSVWAIDDATDKERFTRLLFGDDDRFPV